MANITNYLQQILAARYGKDVRQSIHDAIDDINAQSEKAAEIANNSAERSETAVKEVNCLVEDVNEKLINGEFKGPKGDKGEKGDTGEAGPKGDTGSIGPEGIQGATGPKGDTGAIGPQGPKGDKGDKGDTGESGVVTPVNGFFTLAVDENGDLWAYTADDGTVPEFEYDVETGNLYIIQEV